jgi:hypothetical protein
MSGGSCFAARATSSVSPELHYGGQPPSRTYERVSRAWAAFAIGSLTLRLRMTFIGEIGRTTAPSRIPQWGRTKIDAHNPYATPALLFEIVRRASKAFSFASSKEFSGFPNLLFCDFYFSQIPNFAILISRGNIFPLAHTNH